MWTADRPFPIDVDNLVQDTVEAVRPKLKLFSNKEEAEAAADELDQEYKAKIGELRLGQRYKQSCLLIRNFA